MRTTYYPFIDESTPEGSKTLADSAQDQIDFGVGISSSIGIGTLPRVGAQLAIHFDGSEDNRTGGFEINANSNSSGDKHGARILAYNRLTKNKGFRRLRFQASEYSIETPDAGISTTNAGPTLNITGFGSVGIGTTDPLAQLDVRGDVRFNNKLYDKDGDSGTSGQVLSSTGTQVDWVNVGTLAAGTASQVAVTASNDDSNFNVTFVDSSSGNQSIKADTNTNFLYNPSINRLELNTFSGTGLMLSGSGSDYVGMQLKTSDSSASQTRNIFIDTVNELGNAVANQVGCVQSDGGSHWRWETQPSGDRTDRRVERLRIAADGNVGIGTTSPSVKLDVIGSATVEGDLFLREVPSHAICKINGDGNLNLFADGLVRFYESDNNKLMFTFDVNTTHDDARMYMEGDSDTFFNHPESNQLGFTAGGTETIRIKAGKLGVGTMNPTASLDVSGGIRAFTDSDNLILLNSSDGSIELKRTGGPFIDFADSGGEDHDCRIKQEDNGLAFTTGGNGSANEKLRITSSGHLVPGSDSSYDIGTNSVRFRNLYVDTLYAGITSTTGTDDQDNLVVNGGSTQFAVHQDDSDGEVSLRAQDGSGNNFSKFMTFFTQASGQSAVERLRIAESGNVGINSTNPNSKLTVASGSATAQIEIQRTNGSGGGTIGALNFTAVTGYSVANISAIGDGDNDGAHLVFRTTSDAGEHSPFGGSTIERLRITSSGQIGIGTVSPNSLLHIHQSSTSGFDGLRLTNSTTGVSETSGFSIELTDNETTRIWNYENESIQFGVDNELHGTLRQDGRWCLGPNQTSGVTVLNVFSTNGPSAQFLSNNDAGISIYDDSDNSAVEIRNNNSQLTIDLDHSGQVTGEAFIIEKNGGSTGTAELFRIDSEGQVIFKSMTTTERNALSAQTGGVIYNSSTNKLQVYTGSAWVNLH